MNALFTMLAILFGAFLLFAILLFAVWLFVAIFVTKNFVRMWRKHDNFFDD